VEVLTWLVEHLDVQALVLIAGTLIAVRALGLVVGDNDNTIKASDFIASRGQDGADHGDPKKLAATVFIFSSTLFVGYTFWAHPIDNFWPVAVFFGWAIAMLGIDVFAAWARSFVDRRFGQAPLEPQPATPAPTKREVTHATIDKTTTEDPAK
jgi:hypothetical protein